MIELIVNVRPNSRPRPRYRVDEATLRNMKLDALRPLLVNAGCMMNDELFLDQGVPIDEVREKNGVDVGDILAGEGQQQSIQVMSRAEAKKFFDLEEWKENLPQVDATTFRVDLQTPADLTAASVTTAAGGFGVTTVPGKKTGAQILSELPVAQQISLLQNCGLYPRTGEPETCSALRMGQNDLEFSPSRVIICKVIRMLEPRISREERVSVSFSNEVSRWQSHLVESSRLGVNVPLLFGVQATVGNSTEEQVFDKGVTVHLAKTIALPKAEAKLEEVSLSGGFAASVRSAVESKDGGSALLQTLHKFGLFVATHFVLGGKVVCTSSKTLTEACRGSELGRSFSIASTGAIKARLDSKSGLKQGSVENRQGYTLSVRTTGGFGEGSSSQVDNLGGNDWLVTVATRPETWRVIGYTDDEIRLTIDYLPADLRQKCKDRLRTYFESKLQMRKSFAAGGSGGTDWDEPNGVNVRITGCSMMFDQNIDSIRFTYQDPKRTFTGSWHGASREKQHDFALSPADEIVGLEVGWDKTVDHVLLYTRSGDNKGDVRGRRGGAKQRYTFSLPRIRGFHGRAGHFLDALGVYYYDLANDLSVMDRAALLSLERYLFS